MRTKVAAVLCVLGCYAAGAAAQGESDEWQFQVTPYVWLPTISADLNFDPPPAGGGGSGGPSINAGPTDWLELINGVMLLNGSARKGRFSLATDIVFLSLESEKDRVKSVLDGVTVPVEGELNLSTETDFDGMAWTTVLGYSLQNTEDAVVELLLGARLLDLEAKVDWMLTADITTPGGGVILPAEGSIEQGRKLWDGIIGVRGHFAIGEGNWSVPYYLDIGTGDTDLTWQAMAGFTYSYGWGDLMLVYRHLDYSQGADDLFEQLYFSGPAVGARFRF